jgi:N-methylhydantoinase A
MPLTKNLLSDFGREHHRRYGYVHPNREIELVTLRLRAVVHTSPARGGSGDLTHSAPAHPGKTKLGPSGTKLSGGPPLEAPVLFEGKKLATKIFARADLKSGKRYFGPAIITEYSATTVVPPDRCFRLDPAGNLIASI